MKTNDPKTSSNKTQKLAKLLHCLGFSQTQLATNLNISRQRVNNIIMGRQFFSKEQQIILCKKYNVNLNWLIAGEGEMFITPQK